MQEVIMSKIKLMPQTFCNIIINFKLKQIKSVLNNKSYFLSLESVKLILWSYFLIPIK